MARRGRATEVDAPPERLAYRVDEARPGVLSRDAAPPQFSAMNSTPARALLHFFERVVLALPSIFRIACS
jgi:hypothetical protein